MKTIIVLGGAGYIGSHTCLALKEQGFTPIVVDNFSRGHMRAVQWGEHEECDIADTPALTAILKKHNPAAVIHFAALIEVGEGEKEPDKFYENNVMGTKSVLDAMKAANIDTIVFSSTAAVYGDVDTDKPLTEDLPLNPTSVYGNTKLAAERMIRDYEKFGGPRSVSLRYFNAAGADAETRIGEMHYPETHLMPLVIHAATNLRDNIKLFGTDYDTRDGTCIRDYIHVNDLADAHVKAVQYLIDGGETTYCNLGTGNGFSVREIVDAVRDASKADFNAIEESRRAGDPATLVADNTKASEILGWKPTKTLGDVVESALKWHQTDIYKNFWHSKHNQNS